MSEVAIRQDERMGALDRYDVLDTPQEEAFDRITRLVRRCFDVPISAISVLDGHRQWFKSRQGVSMSEIPRGTSFCNLVIAQDQALVIPDALADERFRDNPNVRGEPHVRFYAGAQLRTPDGHNIGTICAMDTRPREFGPAEVAVLSDLARIVMDELELRTLAATDALTGTLSRRAFRDEAGRALALAIRHKHDLACLVLDVDHFKSVNDVHGHPAGDLVLMEVARECQAALRKSDLLGRLGGEEFGIVLPHTGPAAAMKVAEKLRARIANVHRGEEARGGIAVTASFGMAALDRTVQDLDTLLGRADQALYAAKAEGRNRCNAWTAPPDHKQEARRRVFKAGRLSFNSGNSVVDCTVRTLSASGASLDVISTAGLPDELKLQIESDNLSRSSRITLKRDRHVEVEFV